VKLPVSKHVSIVAILLATPFSVHLEQVFASRQTSPSPVVTEIRDPRTVRLRQFLGRLRCPVKDLAEEFVHAADDNNLDWRLLPSISIIESSGGKAYKNNNIMGWANGDHAFPTVRAGIYQVAFRLGRSFIYRNRSTEEKLELYNPDDEYPSRVADVMYRISPVVDLKPRSPERSNLAL
jgi:hypothetical protein